MLFLLTLACSTAAPPPLTLPLTRAGAWQIVSLGYTDEGCIASGALPVSADLDGGRVTFRIEAFTEQSPDLDAGTVCADVAQVRLAVANGTILPTSAYGACPGR